MAIDRIFHLADIHCRLFDRHDEYRVVFRNFFEKIDHIGVDNSVIVIAGDLLHSKTSVSPELIQLVTEFLFQCAERAPVILIPGNHDFNLKNLSALDPITPIVQAISHPNLHYLKESVVFDLDNVSFIHFSIFDKAWDRLKIPTHGVRVGLYHGPVSGAITDTGFSNFIDPVNVNYFLENSDITLLGDIHKYQVLTECRRVVYCGSLIQQNFAETGDRGFVVWNLSDFSHEFIPVHNPYGMVVAEVNGEADVIYVGNVNGDVPKVKIKFSGDGDLMEDEVISVVKQKYPKSNIFIEKISINQKEVNDRVSQIVSDANSVSDAVAQYLVAMGASEDEFKYIMDYHNMLYKSFNHHNHGAGGWRLEEFSFENMFSYNTENYIDFRNFNGILGIFGSNAIGKTSLLDAIVFAIFGKCPRTSRVNDVISYDKKSYSSSVVLSFKQRRYKIERNGVRSGVNGSETVKFFEIDQVGNIVKDLTQTRRDQTNAKIQSIFGSYDLFMSINYLAQTGGRQFVENTSLEQKNILMELLNINVFSDIHSSVKDEVKKISGRLEAYDLKKMLSERDALETMIGELGADRSANEDLLKELDIQYNEIYEKISELRGGIREVFSIDYTIEECHEKVAHIEREIAELNDRLRILESEIFELDDTACKLGVDLKKYNQEQIINNRNYFKKITNELEVLKRRKERFLFIVKELMGYVKKLESHEFDPNCKYCIANPVVVQANESKKKLIRIYGILNNIEERLREKQLTCESLGDVEKQFAEMKILAERLDNIVLRQERLNNEKDVLVKKIELLTNDRQRFADIIKKYEENLEIISSNEKILKEVQNLEAKLRDVDLKRQQLVVEIEVGKSKIEEYKQQKEVLIRRIEECRQIEFEYKCKKLYLKTVHMNGAPSVILGEFLEVMKREINNLFSPFDSRSVMIHLRDGKYLEIDLVDENGVRSATIGSGMERFVLDILLKNVLKKISQIPHGDIFMIDEGFGSLDDDNLLRIKDILDFIRKDVAHVFCISHRQILRDFVDYEFVIKNNKLHTN